MCLTSDRFLRLTAFEVIFNVYAYGIYASMQNKMNEKDFFHTHTYICTHL